MRVNFDETDQFGEVIWIQTFEAEKNCDFFTDGASAYSVQQTIDGGYIITGRSGSGLYLIKTDSEGNVTSTNIIETPSINKSLLKTIDILGRETNNNKGFQLHIYDDGSVEKKYIIK